MRRFLSLCALILVTVFSGQSKSIEPEKKFMDDMVLESDIIMVGEVMGVFPIPEYGQMYAHVRNVSQIKGFGDINLIYRTGISEDNPDCCVIGRRYLLFVHKHVNGFYVSVGGRQGVVPADEK